MAPDDDVIEGVLARDVDDDAGGASHVDASLDGAVDAVTRRRELLPGRLPGVLVPRLGASGEGTLRESGSDRIDDVQQRERRVRPLRGGKGERGFGVWRAVEGDEDVIRHISRYANQIQKLWPPIAISLPIQFGATVTEAHPVAGGMPERTTLADLNGRPHAEVFETRRPRTVRLQLDADERVPRHTHEGTNVVLHLLAGRLELTLDDETHALEAGELIRFSGDREVSPYAVEPSTAIVVFAPTESGTP